MTGVTRACFESLVAAAVAAPSADNRHVFRMELRGDEIRMLTSDEFQHAASSRRVLGLMSIGAAAQNIELRGRRLGLQLDARWRPDGSSDGVIAEFGCAPSAVIEDPLEGAIESRQSNRRLRFKGPKLAPSSRQQLAEEAAGVDGAGLVWLDETASRRRALQLIRWAETERFRNEALHRELFESIRFDVGWHASTPEGLPAGSLQLPWFERPAFKALRNWRVQRVANLLGTHHFIGMRAADLPCRLAPHLCVITAGGEIESAARRAGRLLQRVWLRATVLGLSLQVFAASPLYALDDSTAISTELRHKLASGWATLCSGSRPFLACRLGYADAPSIRAGRPAANRFMTLA